MDSELQFSATSFIFSLFLCFNGLFIAQLKLSSATHPQEGQDNEEDRFPRRKTLALCFAKPKGRTEE